MFEEKFQKRSILFKVGIILTILFSAITGFLNFGVLYLFGLPILGLLIGLITIWFSSERLKTKIISTAIPLPIILFSFFIFYLMLPKAEPEIFLIPQNFRGQFEIVFVEPCGKSLTYEKGYRLYQIPNDGVLITNAKRSLGVIDRKFYLVDENGNKTELPAFHWSSFEEEKADWHWTFSKTKLSKDLVGVFWAYSNGFSFIVSDFNSLENQNKETKENLRKQFSEKLSAALQECRTLR